MQDLLDLIHAIASDLRDELGPDRDLLQDSLLAIQGQLAEMVAEYEDPHAPEELLPLNELMQEAIGLFWSSADKLLDFLEAGQDELLTRAVMDAEDAQDILSSIEDGVQQGSMVLAQCA